MFAWLRNRRSSPKLDQGDREAYRRTGLKQSEHGVLRLMFESRSLPVIAAAWKNASVLVGCGDQSRGTRGIIRGFSASDAVRNCREITECRISCVGALREAP